jgi:hypothetical protein
MNHSKSRAEIPLPFKRSPCDGITERWTSVAPMVSLCVETKLEFTAEADTA